MRIYEEAICLSEACAVKDVSCERLIAQPARSTSSGRGYADPLLDGCEVDQFFFERAQDFRDARNIECGAVIHSLQMGCVGPSRPIWTSSGSGHELGRTVDMEGEALLLQDTMQLPLRVVLLRLGAAIVLGGAIGLEREVRSRPAGLRTHILVCLAACLFTLIGTELFMRFEPQGNMDPIRIIEAVTAGVAFLAAGTIIRGEKGVRGLTTGAGMWMAGAVGVAVGSGLLILAALSTVAAVVVIALLRIIEPS